MIRTIEKLSLSGLFFPTPMSACDVTRVKTSSSSPFSPWTLDVSRNKDKLFVPLKIGSNGNISMKESEIADLVSRATWQAADFSPSGAVMLGTSVLSNKVGSVLRLFGY